MYQSNHRPGQGGGGGGGGGLTQYVSAPGSFLTSVVESVTGSDGDFSNVGSESLMGTHHKYLSGDSSSMTNGSLSNRNERIGNGCTGPTLQRSYALNNSIGGGGGGGGGGGSSPLIRQSSSPAGFFNHHMIENGFSITKGIDGYITQAAGMTSTVGHGRLKSQLSFTQDSLSQISEADMSDVAGTSSSDDGFTIGSWRDDTNSIQFSTPSNKRTKNNNGAEVVTVLSDIESQSLLFSLATMDNVVRLQNDTVVSCKTRARRGFATHPRSIAERERRGRISDKLKKLQELVPNMDKQTSIADMLDLAMQHINGLQDEAQKLKKDLQSCTCGCKQ